MRRDVDLIGLGRGRELRANSAGLAREINVVQNWMGVASA